MKSKFLPKSSLILAVGLVGLAAMNARAESSAGATPPAVSPAAAPVNPAVASPGMPAPGSRPGPSMMGSQPVLTPEENKILGQARMELQKDPEILELTAQIKALMEKRIKLTEEKLQKINPEAAVILQKLKDAQEKMQAERRAQMEAMQAKYKADQEAKKAPEPAVAPAPSATP